MWDWLDILYYFKWYLILVQIFIVFLTSICLSNQKFGKHLQNKKILMITAHPDDETMFFTPFLNYFQESNITLLCLSNGNADGLGRIRENELEQACKLLKISQLEIINQESLLDGMDKN